MLESGDWTYSVISFAVRNARGEGEYFDGLPPTCVAPDDVTHELGDTGGGEPARGPALHRDGAVLGRGRSRGRRIAGVVL